MRDLLLYCEHELTVRALADLLGDAWSVRYSADHDQIDLRALDDRDDAITEVSVLIYPISPQDLPASMLEDDERRLVRQVVGETWNPVMLRYSDIAVAGEVVTRIATAYTVVIDTDHGSLIAGADWSSAMIADDDESRLDPGQGPA